MKRLITTSILFGVLSSPLAAATWYQDLDGDGFGNASVTVEAATQPLGFVLNADDLNDADPSIGPGGSQLLQGTAGVSPALAGIAALVVVGALVGSGGSTNGTN